MLCVQHDAQMDYYGTKLATCSSDRSVKIFDVRGDQQVLVADLKGSVSFTSVHVCICCHRTCILMPINPVFYECNNVMLHLLFVCFVVFKWLCK